MKKFITLPLVMMFLTNISMAQETVIFRKETNEPSKKKKTAGDQNIVKLAPLGFISGNIPVYFERELTPFLGLQVGIGVTSKNYIREIFSGSELSQPEVKETRWNDGTKDGYSDENPYTDNKHRKYKSGTYFSAEPRIVFESEGLEGNFIGLSYSKGKYNSTSQKINTGLSLTGEPTYSNGSFSEYENITDLFVTFGTQTLYDRISLEYSTGVGLRKIEGEKYAYGRDNIGNFVDGVSIIEKTKIGFNFSLKVGYHF